MDELRVILLIIGIVVIIGIYGNGRRKEKRTGTARNHVSRNNSGNDPHSSKNHHRKNYHRIEPSMTLSGNGDNSNNCNNNGSENERIKQCASGHSVSPGQVTDSSITDSQAKHAEPDFVSKAYNTDIERKIEPVSIENWRFKPIESGLQKSPDGSDLAKNIPEGTPSDDIPSKDISTEDTPPENSPPEISQVNPVEPIKDPEEHRRFAHLDDSLLIVINVMANNWAFTGAQLQEIFSIIGLEYGDMRIYHYYPDDSKQRLFSVASTKEPGCFDFDQPGSYSTKGISLFMLLPGPLDGKLAFDILYGVAAELANTLGGRLCDEDFNKLTKQATAHMQDKISDFYLHRQDKAKNNG